MAARAYVLMTTDVGKAGEVVKQLRQIPGVQNADVLTGPYDLVAVIQGPDNNALGHLVMNEMHGIPEVRSTITLIAVG